MFHWIKSRIKNRVSNCAQCGQADDVGAGDAGMGNVAADRHCQPLDPALVAADGQRIEQRLRRMLMRTIASVDHRAIDFARQKLHRACRVMAHDDQIGPHGVERDRGVDQRLALFHRRIGDRHVHDIGAEALARQFERGLRARRCLKEQVDLRAAAQGGFFGGNNLKADAQGASAFQSMYEPALSLRRARWRGFSQDQQCACAFQHQKCARKPCCIKII